jgi:hypothetical protein
VAIVIAAPVSRCLPIDDYDLAGVLRRIEGDADGVARAERLPLVHEPDVVGADGADRFGLVPYHDDDRG